MSGQGVRIRTKTMEPRSRKLNNSLESSPWVASLRPAVDKDGSGLEIALTPMGHDRLRDSGLETFLNDLEGKVSAEDRAVHQIGFYSATRVTQIEEIFEDTGTFPRLLSALVEPDRYRLLVLVDSGLDWFKGHFPGTPVLPGVVQLHWAARIACSLFGIGAPPRNVNRLKFQNIVVPPRVIELELGHLDRGRIPFAFRSLGVTHSSGTFRFDEPGTC